MAQMAQMTQMAQMAQMAHYSFDGPEGQVSIFNKLLVDRINTHAPLRKVKFTRPVAAWMNDPKIANFQKDLDTRRTIYRNHKSSSNHTSYQKQT